MRTRDDFLAELEKFGPESSLSPYTRSESFTYCRRLAKSHDENFAVVSFLLPKKFRDPFYIIYSYCRWADDLADEVLGASRSLALLDWWEKELHSCYKRAKIISPAPEPKRFVHPDFVGLEEVFRRFTALTCEPFCDLLKAFRQDQVKKSYETYDELLDYCRNSANPVGRILLTLMKRRPNETDLRLADSICTGLQLANFWQDVRRDNELGRSYIPEQTAMSYSSFREMMRDLVEDARHRLKKGRGLVRRVPRKFRIDMKLFIEGGLAILRQIEKIDYQVDAVRPTVPRSAIFFIFVKVYLV